MYYEELISSCIKESINFSNNEYISNILKDSAEAISNLSKEVENLEKENNSLIYRHSEIVKWRTRAISAEKIIKDILNKR